MIKGFFQSCVKLLNDPSSVNVLQNMLERCSVEAEGKLEKKSSITYIQEEEQVGSSG
jgi:hypothetical protein